MNDKIQNQPKDRNPTCEIDRFYTNAILQEEKKLEFINTYFLGVRALTWSIFLATLSCTVTFGLLGLLPAFAAAALTELMTATLIEPSVESRTCELEAKQMEIRSGRG